MTKMPLQIKKLQECDEDKNDVTEKNLQECDNDKMLPETSLEECDNEKMKVKVKKTFRSACHLAQLLLQLLQPVPARLCCQYHHRISPFSCHIIL